MPYVRSMVGDELIEIPHDIDIHDIHNFVRRNLPSNNPTYNSLKLYNLTQGEEIFDQIHRELYDVQPQHIGENDIIVAVYEEPYIPRPINMDNMDNIRMNWVPETAQVVLTDLPINMEFGKRKTRKSVGKKIRKSVGKMTRKSVGKKTRKSVGKKTRKSVGKTRKSVGKKTMK